MNINELFEKIQENFLPEQLKGEFQLQSNRIVWTYDIKKDSEEIDAPNDDDDEAEENFGVLSPEELLQEVYDEDLQAVEEFLDELEEYDNWTLSEPETNETTISFRIF
jgi:hypothetical protein